MATSSALPVRAWRRVWSGTGSRHLLLALLGLLAVIVYVEAASDFRNLQFAAFGYLGIAAGGLTVLTGLNGQLSLGHGAFMAIGAYTTALFLDDGSPVVPLLGVLVVATLVTVLAGALIGAAAARLHGPYIAGATLALAVGVPGIALHFSDTLGGEQGLGVVAPPVPVWLLDLDYFFTGRDLTPSRYLSYVVWVCLIVTFVLLANLSRSRVGRRWRAVRDDDVAAEVAGIHLGRARVSAFVVSTACAGLAGAVMALVVRLTAPGGYTLTLSLTLLTAVVLGGLGSLWGALIGAGLLSYLPQLATNVGESLGLDQTRAAELAPLVYGAVMIAVILLAPTGIAGAVRALRARRTARAERPPPQTTESTVQQGEMSR
ncbi:branched-chain amino acid ABC transporter permease [Marmoricola endophyticus]|uniref:Branched-chain amino acid ABC transporter permease n=1 Tax=Marmoricola endophyticus TaxID=2040280 RepID=A0A917F6M8_9ACTN|nr:branched-chain amino acid ABC transporter permease [Marmoricola endophyticus]GGF52866.1 branched-chain amino acid ABC transporter permease [Marmoricola endophyticus]